MHVWTEGIDVHSYVGCNVTEYSINNGNNTITELRTILQRESQNIYVNITENRMDNP
jgi:hypothetical protein